MPDFTCEECGTTFEVPAATMAKYSGWKPRFCMKHRKKPGQTTRTAPVGGPQPSPWQIASGQMPEIKRLPPGHAAGSKTFRGGTGTSGNTVDLTPEQVLATYTSGPQTGVFTDGGARPNPGQGGWGFVYVREGEVIAQAHGGEARTTNNRMELTAIINALLALPPTETITLFTDSNLCVQTLTQWARGWEKRGWVRKDGEIANLDLVQEAWRLIKARPNVRLQWIKAHDGSRWNEYADALATRGMREL